MSKALRFILSFSILAATIHFSPLTARAFSGGDGSASNPFLISTAADLQDVQSNLSAHYRLTNSIALTGSWTPIGDGTQRGFMGVFDGGNHSITGLNVSSGIAYAGLFSRNNGIIKNLIVESSTSGQVLAEVTVSALHTFAGGITGYNGGTISHCGFIGSVTAQGSPYDFTNSFGLAYAGGIAGRNAGVIENSYANADVRAQYAQKDSWLNAYGTFAGGLVGQQQGGSVTHCYSMGTVMCISSDVMYCGGLVGQMDKGVIQYCYTATAPLLSDGGRYSLRGSFVGEGKNQNDIEISNCFYDSDLSGAKFGVNLYNNSIVDLGEGMGRTTSELKQAQTFSGWGTEYSNNFCVDGFRNSGYPYLSWEYESASTVPVPEEPSSSPFVVSAGILTQYTGFDENIIVPSNVTGIGDEAFLNCLTVKSVIIPGNVKTIGSSAFEGCANLNSVIMGTGVTEIGLFAFYDCTSLSDIIIPNTVKTIRSFAFYGCTGLTSVSIPESVESMNYTSFGAALTSLTEIIVSAGNMNFTSVDGVLFTKDMKTLMVYPAAKTGSSYTIPGSVTATEPSTFTLCKHLTDVTIPASVTQIGENSFKYAAHTLTIHGTSGSAAEAYAKNNSIPFILEPLSKPSSWAAEAVEQANLLGLVPPALNDKYDQTITRAEYCAITVTLYETLTGKTINERKSFPDDKGDVNIQKLYGLGVVSGSNGLFNPSGEFSRLEVAVITANLLEKLGKPLPAANPTFADTAEIPSWAIDAVGQMQAAGLISGIGGNRFGADQTYDRQSAIMLSKLLFDKYK